MLSHVHTVSLTPESRCRLKTYYTVIGTTLLGQKVSQLGKDTQAG